MIKIELIDSLQGLASLGPRPWNELLAHSDMDIPFLTFEWVDLWLRLFGTDSRIAILIFKENNELKGIAPFMLKKMRWRGMPATALSFIANYFSFRSGIISDTDENLYKKALGFLKETKIRYDLQLLQFVPESLSTERQIEETLGNAGAPWLKRQGEAAPYIRINGSWEEFLAARSSKFRKNYRRIMRLYEKLDFKLEKYTGQAETAFEKVIAISRKSWKDRMKTSISNDEEKIRYYRALAGMAASQGWLSLWILEIRGEAAAFSLDLRYKNKIFSLQSSFSEAMKEYSPGHYILFASLKEAFESGMAEYDMLGNNEEYKLRFTNCMRPHLKYCVFSDSLYGRSLFGLEAKLIPLLKKTATISGSPPSAANPYASSRREALSSKTG